MEAAAADRLKVTRTFKASRQRVFRAWTEPELMMRWFVEGDGNTTRGFFSSKVDDNCSLPVNFPHDCPIVGTCGDAYYTFSDDNKAGVARSNLAPDI